MYHIEVAYTLIQLGTNLWVNPVNLTAITTPELNNATCATKVHMSDQMFCSDWPIDRVKEALRPSAVAKSMETK